MQKSSRSFRQSLMVGLAVLAGLFIYAYGFQVTKVDLEETRSERRQTQLVRILRALARPDILEYEKEEFLVDAPIIVGCPEGELNLPEPDTSGPFMTVDPPCADPKAQVRVEGFNFEPNTRGPINFIPLSQVTLQLGNIVTDEFGHFETVVQLPNRSPVPEPQHIQVITRRNVGAPRFTKTAHDTWDKIIETVFMALLATTIGTALAIPVSFFAARNLMKDVRSSVASISLSVLAWPLGIWLGMMAARQLHVLSQSLTTSTWLNVAGVVLLPLLAWWIVRWAVPATEESRPNFTLRMARVAGLLLAAWVAILSLYLLSSLTLALGNTLALRLGGFGFLGAFVAGLGDILGMIIATVVALATGGVISGFVGRVWRTLDRSLSPAAQQLANYILAALAGALLFAILGAMIDWFYQIHDAMRTLIVPAILGALFGIGLAFWVRKDDQVTSGLAVYYVARTILNALRSIEPLIMVIVFAVWVGIGPFAGVLALALHTIAALAKLYSEQVESILPGPLEAVRAAGANRLQTIVYAVIPQIVPPYIAFTMYRWDINVRMSTIIGFAGGGGIGFLLQQNINLLNYRAASAQMVAIAIVVASMDYISARLRERII